MYITGIAEVLATRAVESVKLNHVDNTEAIKSEQEHKNLLSEIKESTEKINRETNLLNDIRTKPDEVVKHLDILY